MKFIKVLLLLIFLILINEIFKYNLFFYYNYNSKKINNPIKIEIDISGAKNGKKGPAKLSKSLSAILPYIISNCYFVSLNGLSISKARLSSDFFILPFPSISESFYDKWIKIKGGNSLILGPVFVPTLWENFPDQSIWKEKRFKEILKNIKGIAVHSDRVRNYLFQRANIIDPISKIKIIQPCTNLRPKFINSFDNRTIDILFFEKYSDLDRRKQALELFNLFKNTSKIIENLIYGNYQQNKMMELANNSKFIIYFSFFDTGAIGLKEIQNYGVYSFSHQKDLVIDKMTSYYIPELSSEYDMKPAFKKIMKIIENITNHHPNSELVGKINQEANQCQNALNDICESIK